MPKRKFTEQEKLLITNLILNGHSVLEASLEFNISESVLYHWLYSAPDTPIKQLRIANLNEEEMYLKKLIEAIRPVLTKFKLINPKNPSSN